jgi:hypothetical protein
MWERISVEAPGGSPRESCQPTAQDWQPPALWGELDRLRPVVVVTQGALANEDFSQLIEPALAGLADMGVAGSVLPCVSCLNTLVRWSW